MGDKKKPAPSARTIGVELSEALRRRLKAYTGANDVKIKDVVSAAIDEYLKKRGA